jgi:hypothetical protein
MRNGIIDWGWTPLDIIMIHQIKLKPTDYISILEDGIKEGKVENIIFAMHSKNFPLDSANIFACLRESGSVIVRVLDDFFTCCCYEEAIIDKNRARIFLPTLKEQRRKIEFKMRKDKRFILGSGVAEYTSGKGKEDLEKIKIELKNRNFILYKTEKKE